MDGEKEPLETWGTVDKSQSRVAWPFYKVISKGMTLTDADKLAEQDSHYKIVCFKVRHKADTKWYRAPDPDRLGFHKSNTYVCFRKGILP